VYGWWAHPELSLHVGFGGRLAVELAIVVDEREILSLFVREGFGRLVTRAEELTRTVPV
jgi:hypothetical protein